MNACMQWPIIAYRTPKGPRCVACAASDPQLESWLSEGKAEPVRADELVVPGIQHPVYCSVCHKEVQSPTPRWVLETNVNAALKNISDCKPKEGAPDWVSVLFEEASLCFVDDSGEGLSKVVDDRYNREILCALLGLIAETLQGPCDLLFLSKRILDSRPTGDDVWLLSYLAGHWHRLNLADRFVAERRAHSVRHAAELVYREEMYAIWRRIEDVLYARDPDKREWE